MPTITDPTWINEEFQGSLECYFLALEEEGVPGAVEFEDKLRGLHSEERGGNFSLDEALAIIAEFQQEIAWAPNADEAHRVLERLRNLYEWVCGPSPSFTGG